MTLYALTPCEEAPSDWTAVFSLTGGVRTSEGEIHIDTVDAFVADRFGVAYVEDYPLEGTTEDGTTEFDTLTPDEERYALKLIRAELDRRWARSAPKTREKAFKEA